MVLDNNEDIEEYLEDNLLIKKLDKINLEERPSSKSKNIREEDLEKKENDVKELAENVVGSLEEKENDIEELAENVVGSLEENICKDTDTEKCIDNIDDLEEVKVDVPKDEINDINLMNDDKIYYELYKKALAKANEAQRESLNEFCKATDIKNTHLLDTVYTSDDYDSDSNSDNSSIYSDISDDDSICSKISRISYEQL